MQVVIVPGNLASSLSNNGRPLWINPVALALGGFDKLALGPYAGPFDETNLDPNADIRPTGPLPVLYARLRLGFRLAGFGSSVYAYDFRKDIDFLAKSLNDYISSLNDTVAIVTHSQGGLVCRRAVQLSRGANISNLIMLAPSISGTLVAAIALAGAVNLIPFVGKFPTLGHNPQPVLKTFSALYQLLPWDAGHMPALVNTANDVREESFWEGLVDPIRFKVLSSYGSVIETDFFNDRMKIIIGSGTSTPGGVTMNNEVMEIDHSYDLPGDGFMTHSCSTIPDVGTYLAPGVSHLGLPLNGKVIKGVVSLLRGQTPDTVEPFTG